MKVLFVHDSYFLNGGDNKYYSEHIDNSLLERYLHLGTHVTFLVRCSNVANTNELAKKFSLIDNTKSSVICIPNFKTPSGYLKHISTVKKEVEKAVLEHDIIIPRVPSALGTLAVNYAKKHKKPFLGEVVGCTWDGYWNYSLKGKVVAPYFFIKQKKTVKKLPYAIYVTGEFLQNRYPTNGKSTNCSNVEILTIKDAILEKRLEKIRTKKTDDPIVIGTVAAIDVAYKGQKYVLQSMAKSSKKKTIYKVVGTGSPDTLNTVANELKLHDRFKVIGPVKHSEINAFLDTIDLYVQPSKQEGLPRALIEAMSRGLPSVGSRTGGIPELLREEFIFDKGNTSQLATIIDNYDNDKMLKEARVNFTKSKEYFIDNIYRNRFNFYHQFLSDHKLPIPEKLKESMEKLN